MAGKKRRSGRPSGKGVSMTQIRAEIRRTNTRIRKMNSKIATYMKHASQTGSRKSVSADAARKAKPPGYRRAKNGTIYYENRRNRSDIKTKRGYI